MTLVPVDLFVKWAEPLACIVYTVDEREVTINIELLHGSEISNFVLTNVVVVPIINTVEMIEVKKFFLNL